MKSLNISIDKRVFNEAYYPYLTDDAKVLVFYGGAGSGKSHFVVQRWIYKLFVQPLCNILVVRAVSDTNRHSTFALFKQVINSWGLRRFFRINASNLSIKCLPTGNEVVFKGLDDVEKLKSITFEKGVLTDVWIEEASEVAEEDYNQLELRLRGGNVKKQIVISFNPISVNHWLKARFFDKPHKNVKILHTTYRDNKFLDEDYVETLESYKEIDYYYYSVYCLGQWGVYGKTVFNAKNVQERLSAKTKPVKTGYFEYDYDGLSITNVRWREDEEGFIKIYEDVIPGNPYVLGGDTAGEGSDFFAAQVVNNVTGMQAASLRSEFDETVYTRQIYCLGMYYNTALLSVEANFTTYPIKELVRLSYPKQFVRLAEDNYTHRPKEAFGFKTTQVTRPIIIAMLQDIMRESPQLVCDKDTLEEMLTFVRNEKGRAEAQEGSHDDMVMALAIAYYSRQQQSYEKSPDKKKAVKWTDDYWEDYYNANEEGKKLLIARRGNPFE